MKVYKAISITVIILVLLAAIIVSLNSCKKVEDNYNRGLKAENNVVHINFYGGPTTVRATVLVADSSGLIFLAEKEAIMAMVREILKDQDIFVTSDEYLAPDSVRQRVFVTESDWGLNGAGFSEIGSWGKKLDNYVFSTKLNYKLTAIAKTIAHEIGHSLGLKHNNVPGNYMYEGLDLFNDSEILIWLLEDIETMNKTLTK